VSPITIGLTVFAFTFGGVLLGMLISKSLPEHHLESASKDMVKVGMGLVVTMSALVLGLLVSSAKAFYDEQKTELAETTSKVILLDRMLAIYGPETKAIRDQLQEVVGHTLQSMWPQESSQDRPQTPAAENESFYQSIWALNPTDDRQKSLQGDAASIAMAIAQTRWLMFVQRTESVSPALLITLCFWLTVVFVSFGLYAPRNATVTGSLFFAALSVSGAIFLIMEYYSPYSGVVHISSASLRSAFAQLGR
jgi:hypothetical protein